MSRPQVSSIRTF
uniref:Uncharacterized protein n=1 Tax=Anguilla anguilla TaxID=7936 RepID=A0A0E9UPS0_ANGAN